MKELIPQLLGATPPKPTKTEYTVLRQLVQWIPPGMIQRLADGHKLDIRKWSAVSHVVALMYGQLAGCDSLNGIVRLWGRSLTLDNPRSAKRFRGVV